MSKLLFSIALLTGVAFLFGCKQKGKAMVIPSDYVFKKFMLQDSLAMVEIYVPNELDTFFEWVHIDDNQCDDFKKYRFADKRFHPIAETGFYWDHPDSAYQLTVYHVDGYHCKQDQLNKLDSAYLTRRITSIKNRYAEQGDSVLDISGELAVYSGSHFLVMAYSTVEGYPVKFRAHYLQAVTAIDSSFLAFGYYTNAVNQNHFIERMKVSLATVKITELPGANGAKSSLPK